MEERSHPAKSIMYIRETNLDRNANDVEDQMKKEATYAHRFIESSTDLSVSTDYHSSSVNYSRTPAPIRVESALMTSDYSQRVAPSLEYRSRPFLDLNTNQTIDLIDRTGAGDENVSSQLRDKQVQTTVHTDDNQYLTLEQVPVHNRPTSRFTSKQYLVFSITVFVFVVLLSSITIFFLL